MTKREFICSTLSPVVKKGKVQRNIGTGIVCYAEGEEFIVQVVRGNWKNINAMMEPGYWDICEIVKEQKFSILETGKKWGYGESDMIGGRK